MVIRDEYCLYNEINFIVLVIFMAVKQNLIGAVF